MKKVFLTTLMMIVSSTALAAGFDWEAHSKAYQLNKDTTLKISTILFQERTYAFQFCGFLGMELADINTVVQASKNKDFPAKVIRYHADFGDRTEKGIWAWTSEPVKKVKDASVFILHEEDPTVEIKNFTEVNRSLLSQGVVPYKGLQAICRPIAGAK